MADISGLYQSNQNYDPKINYNVSYSQIGRNASSVTYRFTVTYARQNGSYGYDIYINYSIGGQSGNVLLKANNNFSASSSCTFDVSCSTNASGGTLYAKIYSYSNTDSTHWQNSFNTGDRTVNKSTFNTPPYWGSGAVINLSPNGIVREDTSSVTVSWTPALDAENTSGMKYKVDRYINGNFSATLTTDTTSTSIVDNIGSGNSGNTYTYRVIPYDNYGVSGEILTNSQTLTKNTLYGATISGNPSINNNTSSFTVYVSGGSNSMGSGNIDRRISSSSVNINNAYIGTGTITISIYRNGTVPTGAYIPYEDIRSLFANKPNQSGSFQINLYTHNDFGSSSSSTITVNVDLRDTPNPPSNIRVTGTKTVNGTSYYIPSLQPLTLTWNNGSDKVNGSSLVYEIQGSTNASSGWKTIASSIASGSGTTSKAVNISESDFTGGGNYYFRVIGYNDYNLSNSATSTAVVLHKYSSPTISLGIANRTTSQLVIPITTSLNTSLPNITYNVSNSTELLRKRNYSLRIKGTSTFIKPSTQLTASPQTVTINGLVADKEYTLWVVVNDTSGLTTNDVITELNIGKYIPIVSVRDKGLGINAFANDIYKLVVGGESMFTNLSGGDVSITLDRGSNASWKILSSGGELKFQSDFTSSKTTYYDAVRLSHNTGNIWIKGIVNASNMQVNNNNVYHTGNKPSADDVGLPLTVITKALTLDNNWIDTGIAGNHLKTGSYIVQVTGISSSTNMWSETFTGVMSWFEGATNGNNTTSEIQLHSAGHANNNRYIYLRTIRQPSEGVLKLQIAASTQFDSSSYTFKFRKLI